MRKQFVFVLFPVLVYACPSPEKVSEAVKKLGIPIKEVKEVEPFKTIKGLCRAEGILEKDKATAEVDFYVTEDGRYLLPFVGEVSYRKAPLKGFKEVWITSLRNPNHKFKLGFLSEDGKYYVPEMVPMEQAEPKTERKTENTAQGQ